MSEATQTITAKAWNPEGELALHIIYTFRKFRDKAAEIQEIVGSDERLPFLCGWDADSIIKHWVYSAEEIGWTAEIEVEGDELPSKRGDGYDLSGEYDLGVFGKISL